ncbi:MAG: DNA primase catalytic subunit PriS [Candidatus Heimdallarchaeota archaeon]|nr:MAG: DNA primase catalytic subunit PriS [Candidatus Heimdallarchaeota archaeon]
MNLIQQRTALRDYYSANFDIDGLEAIINFSNFSTREFGFATLGGKFFRNISFENPKALIDFLVDRTPFHAYVGAVYNEPPSRESPIHTLEWLGHELVFDIDLNEYDAVRQFVCDCQGADQVCLRCWQLINLAVRIIDETLRLDFGMKNIIWIFSGRRGVHGWVTDDIGFSLNQEQRMSVIDYLSVIHGEAEKARIQDRMKLKYDFRYRIEHTVFKYFLKNVRRKDLIDLGFSSSAASNIIKQLEHQEGKIDENLLRNFNLRVAKIDKYDEILRRWVPRIDHKVTIDLRRLLRLPNSIHGKTGKVARILDPSNIFSFNPDGEPSVFSR